MKNCYHCKKETDCYEGDSLCKKCRKRYEWERAVLKKKKAVKYKGGKCIKCGYKEYYGSLDFHHRNPKDKEFSWSKMRLRNWSDITKELDKCDLLCRNCHGETHKIEIGDFWFPHKETPKPDKKRICKQCEKLFEYKYGGKSQIFCSKKCYSLSMRKYERPTKEKLLQMAETMSWSDIGIICGGADRRTVRKWARSYSLL